jgi:RNA polymerase sigma factor (sigma-70 family)
MPAEDTTGSATLAALYDREHAGMLRVACVLVGSAAIAEEIVQDAFVAVGERWGQIANPGAYLRTAVVNGCRTSHRRRATEERYASGTHRRVVAVEPPAELVELHDALTRLSPRARAVVVLRYLVDLPDDAIAGTLGCRVATVRSIAHRALLTLRKELS